MRTGVRIIAATIDHGNDDLSGEDSLADTETDSVLRVTMIIVQVEVVVTRVMSSVGLEWNREQNLTPTLICSPSTASTLVRLCSTTGAPLTSSTRPWLIDSPRVLVAQQ